MAGTMCADSLFHKNRSITIARGLHALLNGDWQAVM